MNIAEKTKQIIKEMEKTLCYFNKYLKYLDVKESQKSDGKLCLISFKGYYVTLVDEKTVDTLNVIIITYFNALENQKHFNLI